MSILTVIGLSHFVREDSLFQTLSAYVGMVMPGYAAILNQQVHIFLGPSYGRYDRNLGHAVFQLHGLRVLQNALSVIFPRRVRSATRNFLFPLLFLMCIYFNRSGIVLISFITGAMEILEKRQFILFGWSVSLELTLRVVLYILGVIGEVLLLTSIYLFMPVVRIGFRHALIGGITATILWEITRRVLVWYYSTLSMVNVIYGSFATTVVALLITEAIALIVL